LEQQGLQGPRIALLIDFDNVVLGVDDPPGFDAELVMNALRSRGVVVLGRAYGDWYRHNRHRRKLMEQGIELVETPAFGPVIKNSADIRIALDAFEIGMLQSHISEFCLVSGDSDFLPLIKRLQLLGKSVVVIAGNKFTSELIRRNCNEYISYENLLAESVGATEDASTLDGAFALLKRTISTMDERGQDARSSSVKQMMLQLNPVFSERSFGCHQFKQFLDKACANGIIRLGRRDSNSGEYQVMLIDENGNSSNDHQEDEPTEKPLISDLETAPVPLPKKSRVRAPKPAEEPVKAEGEETGEINLEEEIANNASTVSSARRGRLRFSGRTWRSGGTSTKTEEKTTDTAGTDPVESLPESQAETANATEPEAKPATNVNDEKADSTTAATSEKTEETNKEEKPKPKTTRRRKATTTSSKTSSKAAADAKEEETEKPAEEKPKKTRTTKKTAAKTTSKTKEDSGEEKPKKTVRRRSTAKKVEAESPAPESTDN